MTEKDGLREILRYQRKAIPTTEARERSDEVLSTLLDLQEMDSKSFCVYISMGKEVYTHDLIEHLLDDQRIVTVPRVGKRDAMHACRFLGWADLEKGNFGILVPTTRPYRGRLDVCIVPGLGFTKRGERIGYGKGHYDRFLLKHPESTVIGLAYDCQVLPKLPQENHDRLVDIIVTEEHVFRRKNI